MLGFVDNLISKVNSGEFEKEDILYEIIKNNSPDFDAGFRLYHVWIKPCNNDKSELIKALESFKNSSDIFSGDISNGRRVAKFEKVSYQRFKEDIRDTFGEDYYANWHIESMYEDVIKLPKRASKGSAGYDFISPVDIHLRPGESIKIPTGIRCRMHPNWVLKVYPRSGHGFKYRVQLDNTVGIIDSDYCGSDNEGHIFVKITNDGKYLKEFKLEAGEKFCQGIFVEYGITIDDECDTKRNGGFGSTM